MAEVPRQGHNQEARIMAGSLAQDFHRVVGATVVDENDLVRTSRHIVEHGSGATQQLRDNSFLVIDGNGQRYARGLIHSQNRSTSFYPDPPSTLPGVFRE